MSVTIYQFIVLGVMIVPLLIVLDTPDIRLNICNAIIWVSMTGMNFIVLTTIKSEGCEGNSDVFFFQFFGILR